MKIYKCTESQPHWYLTNRKPTKCVNCGKKEVRPSMFGMLTFLHLINGRISIIYRRINVFSIRIFSINAERGFIART